MLQAGLRVALVVSLHTLFPFHITSWLTLPLVLNHCWTRETSSYYVILEYVVAMFGCF